MPTRRAILGQIAAGAAHRPAPANPSLLVAAARRQEGVTLEYDRGYHRLAYPGGDVRRRTGVCCDVVVRAARDAWGVDLQRLVHEDMARAFHAYPQRWGLPGPDANIDHRRVPNLETYWTRAGARLWHGANWGVGFPGPLLPGDLLTWRTFGGDGPHVAIVSQGSGPLGSAWPKVIENYGWGVHEDLLAQHWLDSATGHFRWLPRV